jgi:hypothetical protein
MGHFEDSAGRPQQPGNQGARPSQTEGAGDGADLHIFGSLGVSLGVVLESVSGFARSAVNLLPISEEHGTAPAAQSLDRADVRGERNASKATCAPSRQVSSRTICTGVDASLGGVARFGEAAGAYPVAETDRLQTARPPVGAMRRSLSHESLHLRQQLLSQKLQGERHRRGSSSSLDVSGAHRASAEQQMWESLPSARDGLRVKKQKDPCDKATHSKISSWMSKAEPAPPPPPAESDGGLALFNKLMLS